MRQPYELRSTNAEWSAQVDPSSQTGKGPCNVRVERAGKLAWEATLPFTLYEAELASSGHLAGYGFTEGLPWMAARGEFVVAIVDPAGKTLLEAREPMVHSPFDHQAPNPDPRGVFLADEGRELVVRVRNPDVNEGGESWWRYELATGTTRPPLNPSRKLGTPLFRPHAKDVKAIEGTPLLLVEWHVSEYLPGGESTDGSHFALLDGEGAPVWQLHRPTEMRAERIGAGTPLYYELPHTPGILALPAPRRFELRHVSEQARVTYEVVAGTAEKPWEVREVSRSAWAFESSERKWPAVEPVPWRNVVTVPLEIEQVDGAERTWIEALAPSSDRSVRFVQKRGFERTELGTLDAEGRVSALLKPKELPESRVGSQWLWLGDGTWLAVRPGDDERAAKAWIVWHDSGAVSEILDTPGGQDLAFALRPDGGFVVLDKGRGVNSIALFDASGVRQADPWRLDLEDVNGVDVAVGHDSTVYVLDNFDGEVACFDLEGKLKRVWPVASPDASEDDEPYLTDILIEPSGNLLVCDFDSDNGSRWLRFDTEGKFLGSFSVHRANGGVDVDRSELVALDDAGGLWGAVNDELFRIDTTGVATSVYGTPARAARLEEPDVPTFDALRRTLIRDDRSRDVFVFSAHGKLVRHLDPSEAALGRSRTFGMHVVSGPQGRFLVQPDDYHDRWLELDEKGKTVRERQLGGEMALWLPDGGFWLAKNEKHGDCELWRVDAQGKTVLRIERLPSRRFFVKIEAIGPGPDGGVAVLHGQGDQRGIQLYDAQGMPKGSLALPPLERAHGFDAVAWAGDWALASGYESRALLVHVASGKSRLAVVPGGAGSVFGWTLSPDGRELWCAGLGPARLIKVPLPTK